MAVTQLLDSRSHVHLRADFELLLGQVRVNPRFHRQHHAIAEGQGTGTPGGPADVCGRAFRAQQWLGLRRRVGR
jgi:hypothetical protein